MTKKAVGKLEHDHVAKRRVPQKLKHNIIIAFALIRMANLRTNVIYNILRPA